MIPFDYTSKGITVNVEYSSLDYLKRKQLQYLNLKNKLNYL